MDRSRRRLVFIAACVVVIGGTGAGAVLGIRHALDQQQTETVERANIETRLTRTSNVDATADQVDKDYQFKLAWPGKGYKMMGEADAARMMVNAKAAVLGEAGCAGALTAEYLPGISETDAVDALVEQIQGTDKRVAARAEGSLGGKSGTAVTVDTKLTGADIRFELFVVLRDGWVMNFIRWRAKRAPACSTVDRSLTFLEGPVSGRAPTLVREREEHRLYSIRDGVYEDPWRRIRVKAPPNCQIVAGRDAGLRGPETAVVLVGKGVDVMIEVETDTEAAPDVGLAWFVKSLGAALPSAPAFSRSFAGGTLAVYDIDQPKPHRSLVGRVRANGRVLSFKVLYAPALRAEAEALLDEVLAGTTLLSAEDALSAQAALPSVDPDKLVEMDRSLRSEKFVDYPLGLRATLPSQPGTAALGGTLIADARLSIVHWTGNAFTAILARPAATNVATEQLRLGGEVLGVSLKATDVEHPPSPAVDASRMSADYRLGAGGDGALILDTFERSGQWIHVVTWGAAVGVDAVRSSTDGFVSGLALGPPIEAEVLRGGHLENARLGFELDLPGSGWSIAPFKAGEIPGGVAYEAKSGKASVLLFCMHIDGADEDFLQQIMEQAFARAALERMGVPTRTDARLGGLPARRITWSGALDGIVAREDATVHVIVVQSADAEAVYSGFRLLP